jgi:hypothetical protein
MKNASLYIFHVFWHWYWLQKNIMTAAAVLFFYMFIFFSMIENPVFILPNEQLIAHTF